MTDYTPNTPTLEYIRELYATTEALKVGSPTPATEYKEFDQAMAEYRDEVLEAAATIAEGLGHASEFRPGTIAYHIRRMKS